ncbi:hypothetical protein HCX50_02065 [Microbacterium oxydans]|uniref:hypothetical protein n=1 Tax=Microbacterium sp. B19(2022) TaxID=2914045 RepID=UPI0014305651|nr:hypothetical protein [Microbacterium sp. B19(2022)]NJI58210.1 hypothetical protein [Microbacterium sp. B19(2022)]
MVTRGAAGLMLGRGDEVIAVPAHRVEVVGRRGAVASIPTRSQVEELLAQS